MKQTNIIYAIGLAAVIALAALTVSAQPAPSAAPSAPANLSLTGIINWVISGGHIASGTGSLPAVGAEGERYVDLSTPTAPLEYLSHGGAWRAISGGGGGTPGTTVHSELADLAYAESGHTGFAASSDLPNNASFTLAGLSEKSFESLTNKPTTLASYGITDAALDSDLDAHTADQIDPHGATMTVSQELYVGDSNTDTYMGRSAPGTLQIASYVAIISETATPTKSLATGTLWYDGNTNKLRCYDGSSWHDLW